MNELRDREGAPIRELHDGAMQAAERMMDWRRSGNLYAARQFAAQAFALEAKAVTRACELDVSNQTRVILAQSAGHLASTLADLCTALALAEGSAPRTTDQPASPPSSVVDTPSSSLGT